MQISITVPGCLHGRFTQERQEEEEGTAYAIVFEKEEGEEEERGLNLSKQTSKTTTGAGGDNSVTDTIRESGIERERERDE